VQIKKVNRTVGKTVRMSGKVAGNRLNGNRSASGAVDETGEEAYYTRL
jgi:hypothetical protein